MQVVDLLVFFLNDLVIDSPHLGRARRTLPTTDNPRSNRFTKKCPYDIPSLTARSASVVIVMVEDVVVAIEDAEKNLLQTMDEYISVPSLEV
jgi:hypothetical protein